MFNTERMQCRVCGAQAVSTDFLFCPEHLLEIAPNAALNVGLDETPIDDSVLRQAPYTTPGFPMMPWDKLKNTHSFHFTDFGHIASVSLLNGRVLVWTELDDGHREWLDWDEYMSVL